MSKEWAIYLRENPDPTLRVLGPVWHVCLNGELQEWFFGSASARAYIDINKGVLQ